MGRWQACWKQHMSTFSSELRDACDIMDDVYSSSTLASNSLLDSLENGSITQKCSEANYKTILLWFCEETEPERTCIETIVPQYDETLCYQSLNELVDAYDEVCNRADKHFITIIVASHPAIGSHDTIPDNTKSVASLITQMLTARAVIQNINRLFAAARNTHFVASAYHTLEFKSAVWKGCAESFAIASKSLKIQNTLMSPSNVVIRALRAINVIDFPLESREIVKNITLFETDDLVVKLICRVMISNKKFILITEPETPLPLSDLEAACANIVPRSMWRVKDPYEMQEDLLEDEKWTETDEFDILQDESQALIKYMVTRRVRECKVFGAVIEEEIAARDENDNQIGHEFNVEAEPLWLQSAAGHVNNIQIDKSDISVSPEISWREKIKECIHAHIGFVPSELEELNSDRAYTTLLCKEEIVILNGSFPPTCFGGMKSCTDINNKIYKSQSTRQSVLIGKFEIDVTTYVQCDSMAVYRAIKKDHQIATAHTRKGSVRRLEAKRHIGKILSGY